MQVFYNFKDNDMKWVEYRPKAKDARSASASSPKEFRSPTISSARNIVHLPTVKCHIYTTTTGAMKNAFGGLLATKRHYILHSWIHRTLGRPSGPSRRRFIAVFSTIMDRTTAGNGPGPRTMIPVVKDYMLASADQVAIDAVAAKMMGFDPMSLQSTSRWRMTTDSGSVTTQRHRDRGRDDVSHENWGFYV